MTEGNLKERKGKFPVRVVTLCALDLSIRVLLYNQVSALRKGGYDVQCICSDGPEVNKLRDDGFDIHTIEISRRIRPLKDIRAVIQLWRFFRLHKVDIVHTHTPKAALLGLIAARIARVPIRINTIHGLYFLAFQPGIKRKIFKAIEIWACRLATHNLSQSQEDVDLLRSRGQIPTNRLSWLGNGVDLRRFNHKAMSSDERLRVRKELDIPQDAFVVGIVARMVAEKGLEELFQSIRVLQDEIPNLILLHIGFIDRSRGDELTPDRAKEIGIKDNCRFVGQRGDIPQLMTAMDIYVLPSYREGYPRSVMEANAMGLPAIVTDIRGCREAVIHENNGLLVPVRSITPLVDAIRRLYQDEELRENLSRQAVIRAKTTFDEQKVIDQILARYSQELSRLGRITKGSE